MGCNLNRHSPFFWWCQLDKEEFWIFHSRHVNRMVTILGQHNCFQCGWLLSTTNNVNKKGVITRLIRVITGIIIQLSYTVRIPIFWLIGLYHVKLGCDETTSLTSLSWCRFNTSYNISKQLKASQKQSGVRCVHFGNFGALKKWLTTLSLVRDIFQPLSWNYPASVDFKRVHESSWFDRQVMLTVVHSELVCSR